MALTVQQLTTPITAAQFRASAITALQSLGLQPTLWAQGSVASSILTVSCNALANLSTQLSNAIAGQWNPTASGGWLQLLSYYVYGNLPRQATFASGNVVLTNTGGFSSTFAPFQATFASTVANAQGVFPSYQNTASFTITPWSGSGPFPTVTVPVQCTFAGSLGNSAPGFVTQLVTQMLGVACTNTFSILGVDALTDAQLRQLNINSLAARSVFGPRNAYAYAIQSATSGDPTAPGYVAGIPVNVNRFTISVSSHTGLVTIYACGPDGTLSLADQIGIALNIDQIARPDCVTVGPDTVTLHDSTVVDSPAPAVTVNYQPNVTVYVLAPKGVTAAALQAAILAALAVFFEGSSNPIGGITATDDNSPAPVTGIFESGVTGVIAQGVATITGCVMLSTRFTAGTTGSDVPLSANEVAVLGMTTSNVTVIPQYVGN